MKKVNKLCVYRVQARIEDGEARLQLFVAADERAVQFLRQEMAERPVTFVFRKENGEIVRRTGTLQMDYIGEHYTFRTATGSAYDNPRILNYWDIGRGGWRSCLCERLIGYFEGLSPNPSPVREGN